MHNAIPHDDSEQRLTGVEEAPPKLNAMIAAVNSMPS